jgi:1,4-alpha-glucan branching enzyme
MGVQKWISDLNRIYRKESALHQVDFHYTGFEWIDFHDKANSIISLMRKSNNGAEKIIAVYNFTPVPRANYRLGVPELGEYMEILNSDSSYYEGSNLGNVGKITAEAMPHHGRQYSLNLTLPPLAVVFLKRHSSE